MSVKSAVSAASSESKALRATVPQAIVLYLGLNSGDKLEWTMQVEANGERTAVVRKVKQ